MIYLDVDGVIADFVGGAMKVHGVHIPPKEIKWNFFLDMGFQHENDPAFWGPLNNVEFWENLEPLDDGMELAKWLLKEHGDHVTLCTAANRPEAAEGRRRWVNKYFPELFEGIIFSRQKWRMAGKDKLLIDDNDDNIEAFYNKKGHTITIPRPWNKLRDLTCKNGKFSSNLGTIQWYVNQFMAGEQLGPEVGSMQ
jgi:5'(3')-deoxyribonucleotidase